MSLDVSVTWLFVPGDRPERFDKAVGSGADAVVVDLEDAVAPSAKVTARVAVADWLSDGHSAWVRINAYGTSWHDEDVAALVGCPGLLGFMVPKAEDPTVIAILGRRLHEGQSVVALIESARGVVNARAIAECDVVSRLAFGALDFALDIAAVDDDHSLLLARSALVLASRVAGISAPIDGVTTSISAPEQSGADARKARALGFGAKLCVHPNQLGVVAMQFRPNLAEIEWAQVIVEQWDDNVGATTDADGRMIDKPVIQRARLVLARAGMGSDATA